MTQIKVIDLGISTEDFGKDQEGDLLKDFMKLDGEGVKSGGNDIIERQETALIDDTIQTKDMDENLAVAEQFIPSDKHCRGLHEELRDELLTRTAETSLAFILFVQGQLSLQDPQLFRKF